MAMEQDDVERILWDLINDAEDDVGYQAAGVRQLAELIVTQDRRITALETKLGERTNGA